MMQEHCIRTRLDILGCPPMETYVSGSYTLYAVRYILNEKLHDLRSADLICLAYYLDIAS